MEKNIITFWQKHTYTILMDIFKNSLGQLASFDSIPSLFQTEHQQVICTDFHTTDAFLVTQSKVNKH